MNQFLGRLLFNHTAGKRSDHDFFTTSWIACLFTQLFQVTCNRVSRDVEVVGYLSDLVSLTPTLLSSPSSN